ncbi:MAG: hypothetical protein R3337_08460 [Gammaproteobacteria bacterium]|nr:hypothetical protein [Gammaproteobacteria bacterium]
MILRHISLLTLYILFAATAPAGEFNSKAVDSSLEWKPTGCSKPARLFFNITDVDSYNAAVEEYNEYLLKVRTYRECINEEAQADAQTAAQSITNGLDRTSGELRREIDTARSELDSAKRLLQ